MRAHQVVLLDLAIIVCQGMRRTRSQSRAGLYRLVWVLWFGLAAVTGNPVPLLLLPGGRGLDGALEELAVASPVDPQPAALDRTLEPAHATRSERGREAAR